MSEKASTDADDRHYKGQDVLYREKGVTALDVQRAADALLRRGQKPSIAAVREELGGGSPNTLAPLLEKYWKGLGTRLPSGPESLERVPESLARMTEALWLRSLDEARERAKASLIGASPSQRETAALQGKVMELTAALAESKARSSELEAQLLASLRDRMELREQMQQLAALLRTEQELRVQERRTANSRSHAFESLKSEILALRPRKRAVHPRRKAGVLSAPDSAKARPTKKGSGVSTARTAKRRVSERRQKIRRVRG